MATTTIVKKTMEGKGLNLKQKLFCNLYVGKHLGNALQSYLEAYKGCDYNTARVEGPRHLLNPAIKEMIRIKLDKQGFTDENVDAHHLFLINQFEDLPTKARMIEHYNKIKKRLNDSPKREININAIDEVQLKKLRDMKERILKRTDSGSQENQTSTHTSQAKILIGTNIDHHT